MELIKELSEKKEGTKRPFIRGQMAIESMRDNGFLSAAHALAELIDNSVQARADRIELIAFEKRKEGSKGKRATKQIEKIGILDNGCGMDEDTLHLALEFGASRNRKDVNGIGKFGMGLPNSSISQCKRVEVWSWTEDSKMKYTYLDIDEMIQGELEYISYPIEKNIPYEFIQCLSDKLSSSGTFVLWSKVDRCRWKTGASIYKHTQDIVGRMYRYFLDRNEVIIRFKSAELNDEKKFYKVSEERIFKSNDPLYLMKNTSLPELPGDYAGESMFELVVDREPFQIKDEKGIDREITITGTVLKENIANVLRKQTKGFIGSTIWGTYAGKNIGLSVVRSERELLLASELTPYPRSGKEKARWYGIEISFPPSLDKIFGVTNNKQHAINLKLLDKSEDYKNEGFNSWTEYQEDLEENNDPKLQIYKIIERVNEIKIKLAKIIETYRLKTQPSDHNDAISDSETASGCDQEREKTKVTGVPSAKDQESIEKMLEKHNVSNPKQKAESIFEKKMQTLIEKSPLSTRAFFDVTNANNLTLLQINENHVFCKAFFDKIPEEQEMALKLCLAGWARMEREAPAPYRDSLVEIRKDWGVMLETYLKGFAEEEA